MTPRQIAQHCQRCEDIFEAMKKPGDKWSDEETKVACSLDSYLPWLREKERHEFIAGIIRRSPDAVRRKLSREVKR